MVRDAGVSNRERQRERAYLVILHYFTCTYIFTFPSSIFFFLLLLIFFFFFLFFFFSFFFFLFLTQPEFYRAAITF